MVILEKVRMAFMDLNNFSIMRCSCVAVNLFCSVV